jgi:hypothetical protein
MDTPAATILFLDALVMLSGPTRDQIYEQVVWAVEAPVQVKVDGAPIISSVRQQYHLSQAEQRIFKKALLRSARLIHRASAPA